MPQGKRKSAEEILGVQAPRKSAEEILGVQPSASPTSPGFLENLAIGTKQGALDYIVNPALSLVEAAGSLAAGDPRPAAQIAERAGRGLLKTVSAFDPAGAAYQPVSAEQDPAITAIQAQQAARQANSPGFQQSRAASQELASRAAADPSLSGKITRGVASGVVGAVPLVATGIASGGSIPAIAATAAVQSAAQPENLALNVAGAVTPIPVGRVVAPIIRRIRGTRSGAVAPAAEGAATQIRATGPVTEATATRTARPTPEAILGIEESPLEVLASKGGKISEVTGISSQSMEQAMALEAGTLVSQAERTPILKTITTLRKTGLLTGIKTHIRNIAGTGVFQISEEAARVPAAIADIAASAITKRRTISGPSLSAMSRSGYEAATKGIREAGQIIKNGVTADDLQRLQLDRELNSGSKILDAYANGVFRLLSAEDKVFRTYAYTRALQDRARSQALTEIRQGKIGQGKLGERVRELLDSPPEDIAASAIADAEVAVFTNENLTSRITGAVKQELKKTKAGRVVNFMADTVMPFTKTPANIIARMLDYSPVGFGNAGYKVAKGIVTQAFSAEEQRAFAQTFGRATIGSGLIALGWKLYEAGLMTGLYEDEPSKRTRDQAAGRIPGALLIGDTWHQLTGFAPLGNLMAIGASLAREVEQERTPESKSVERAALGVLGSAVAEQPLLEAARTLTEPGSPAQKLGSFAGSFVPTAVSDVGELIDQQQRDTRGQGFTGQVAKRIPGVRQTLPGAIDALGRPIEDRATQVIDPTRTTTAREQTEPLIRELIRLDIGLSKMKKKPQEPDDQYRARIRRFGTLYESYGLEMLSSPRYQKLDDKLRRKTLDSLSSRVKVQVQQEDQKGRMAGNPKDRLNANTILNAVIANAKRQ